MIKTKRRRVARKGKKKKKAQIEMKCHGGDAYSAGRRPGREAPLEESKVHSRIFFSVVISCLAFGGWRLLTQLKPRQRAGSPRSNNIYGPLREHAIRTPRLSRGGRVNRRCS